MATTKRTYEEVDPDYTDACEQQTKRQRELEHDAKQTVSRRVQGIVRNEFRTEINNKEMELLQVDRRLNEARLTMDRLRACIISTYYGQINQTGSSEMSRMNGPPSSIHPSVKKYLGKRPSHHETSCDTSSVSQTQTSSKSDVSLHDVLDSSNTLHYIGNSGREQQTRTLVSSPVYQSPLPAAVSHPPLVGLAPVPFADATTYDDRHSRFKIKKTIIIGNVSKYIPVDHREANDKSSHKWMVYVRGPKSEANISGFVKKVWFFLHHSYKPNDLVEISSPPFHLTRRGWGEFPVRVQLHFVDPRNKKVDIIHQLKLDKTFSGLQTLGAETTVELDLEKDFSLSDTNSISTNNHTRTTTSSSSSYHHQPQLSCSSVLNTTILPSEVSMTSSQNQPPSTEQSHMDMSAELETDNNDTNKDIDIKDIETSLCYNTVSHLDSYFTDASEMGQPSCEIEVSSTSRDNNEEYHVTIVHDVDDCGDNNQKKNLEMRGAVSDNSVRTVNEDMSIYLSAVSDAPSCVSASLRTEQTALSSLTSNTKTALSLVTASPKTALSSVTASPKTALSSVISSPKTALSSVTSSPKTSLTIINKPQWMNSDSSHTSVKSDILPMNFTISQPSGLSRTISQTSESLQILQSTDEVGNTSNVFSLGSIQSKTDPIFITSALQNSRSSHTSIIPTPQSSKTGAAFILSTPQNSKPGPTSIISTSQNSTTTIDPVKLSNYLVMNSNKHSVKSSSTLTNVNQVCSPDVSLPSHLLSLSAQSTSNISQVLITPTNCSGQSSFPISLPQHVTVCSSSENLKSVIEQCAAVSLPQKVQLQVKKNQPPHPTSTLQKVIILKPNTSNIVSPGVSANTAGFESRSLLQSKPSVPRQVSLLTGRVFAPPTPPIHVAKISSANHESNDSLLVNNCTVINSTSDKTATPDKLTNQMLKCVTLPGSKILQVKTVNCPSLSVSSSPGRMINHSHTSTNNITNVSGLVMQGRPSLVDNVSAINAETIAENPLLPISLVNNSVPLNHLIVQANHNRQTGMKNSNIILHIPGQDKPPLMVGHNLNTYPKMSAIGMTKFGKNCVTVPTQGSTFKPTTDEERKKNQYEVLMAWKRNRFLHEKGKHSVKIPRDIIEGEADIIPELNLEDYISMGALMRAAVKLHPLIQAGVNKLTHPYCAESLVQWMSWTLGKQLASEWHRACFVLKYLKLLLGSDASFRGEHLMTTRQLVRWCRLHAFSPSLTVSKIKLRSTDDVTDEDSNPLHSSSSHVPYLTPANTLDIEMLSATAANGTEDIGSQDLDLLDIVDTDTRNKVTTRVAEPADENMVLELLPPSDGAIFVQDQLRKRGIKLQPNEIQPGVMSYTAADMLYKAMQEFIADVLRETVSVGAWQNASQSSSVEITRRDVHAALTHLPEAAFSCNKFLGKPDLTNDANGR